MSRAADSPDPGAPGSGAVVRGKFRPARGLVAKARPEPVAPGERPVRRTNAARLARQLALAHWIERAVEDGRVASYGEAARALGLTEPRGTPEKRPVGSGSNPASGEVLGTAGGVLHDRVR